MPISYDGRVSDSFKEETFKERSNDTAVILMTLTHASWDEPLRLTSAAKDVLGYDENTNRPILGIISRGEEYMYIGVGVAPPSTQDESPPEGRITFPTVSPLVTEKLMTVDKKYPNLSLEVVAWSDPDTVEASHPNLSLKEAGWDAEQGQASMIHRTASAENSPWRTFNIAEYPNAFSV